MLKNNSKRLLQNPGIEMLGWLDRSSSSARGRASEELQEHDPLRQFKTTMIENCFSYDHDLFGFRSRIVTFTYFDKFPGGGILLVLHCLALVAGTLSAILPTGRVVEDTQQCTTPRSKAGTQVEVVFYAYAMLCFQTFSNLIYRKL